MSKRFSGSKVIHKAPQAYLLFFILLGEGGTVVFCLNVRLSWKYLLVTALGKSLPWQHLRPCVITLIIKNVTASLPAFDGCRAFCSGVCCYFYFKKSQKKQKI